MYERVKLDYSGRKKKVPCTKFSATVKASNLRKKYAHTARRDESH
jgi:hypothetical protein